ncbi:MAG: hypothetical protein KBC35_01535 [Candidatus Pacebacteria bacterium]|nr:hypothetical protein [Candidatus Paceibacterota bacterium]
MERFPVEKAVIEAELLQKKAKEKALLEGRDELTAEDYNTAEQALDAESGENISDNQVSKTTGMEEIDSKQESFEFVKMKNLARILMGMVRELDKRDANRLNEILDRNGVRALAGSAMKLEEMTRSNKVDIEEAINEFLILSKVFSNFGPGRDRAVRDDLGSIKEISRGFGYVAGEIKGVYSELKKYSDITEQDFSVLDQSFRSFVASTDKADRFIRDRGRALERYSR